MVQGDRSRVSSTFTDLIINSESYSLENDINTKLILINRFSESRRLATREEIMMVLDNIEHFLIK